MMMKSIAAAVVGITATTSAFAQAPKANPPVPTRSLPAANPPAQSRGAGVLSTITGGGKAKADPAVGRTSTAPQQGQPAPNGGNPAAEPPKIQLPVEPIEPYLLTRDNGPFMIMAYIYRGPEAAKQAQALAMELRGPEFQLPAYVYYLRIQPGGSNVRNVPPTAPGPEKTGQLTAPEKYRSYDEAAVLVGNYKSIDEADGALKKIKGLHPVSIDGPSSIWTVAADVTQRKTGLKRAFATQNPLVAADRLFPGRKEAMLAPGATLDPLAMTTAFANAPKVDTFIRSMNQGSNSLLKCPGPYTLTVAHFNGRSTFNTGDLRFKDQKRLEDSPLQTAHEDAEKLAKALSESEQIRRSGYKVYVWHDRSSSLVTVGAFEGVLDPRAPLMRKLDPAAEAMRKSITEQIDLFRNHDGSVKQAAYNPKTKLAPYEKTGEFFHLAPDTTLMAVPK